MEMWIRSQDGERLIKIKEILAVAIEKGKREVPNEFSYGEEIVLGYKIVTVGSTLGIYKTKERALEVLDNLQKCLTMSGVVVYNMPKE